ncbi:MAG: hypothetical protein E7215_06620 [Clostridium sulfidigenes]|uniref:Uncharacterized protein n=1 Tax=Clostridium sulfidigenes TaxID=318464 RepID=A0A927ZIM0_9CLOT|nr:hypothetical protein [Clostridium sulfidigenes]
MKRKIFIGILVIVAIGMIYIIYPKQGTFEEFIINRYNMDNCTSVTFFSLKGGIDSSESWNIYKEENTMKFIDYMKNVKMKENRSSDYGMEYLMTIIGSYKEEESTGPIRIDIAWINEKEIMISYKGQKRRYYKIVDEDFSMDKIKALLKDG